MRCFQIYILSTLLIFSILFLHSPSNLVQALLARTIATSRGPFSGKQQGYLKTESALYGIRGFRKWFEQQFPSAITYLPNLGYEEENKTENKRTDNTSSNSHDSFDHVLIDMNQMLHTTMRRARSEGHALTILLREIDYCIKMTSPKKSLVFAMDGSPGAGKLATQRRHRLGSVWKAQWKREAHERREIWRSRRSSNATRDDRSSKQRRILDHDEMAALCITPGTSFMERARNALYYYVWQRFSNPKSSLSRAVKVYISSSDTPGEGEIKLLDWINLHAPTSVYPDATGDILPGDSIAILGGDSDLVLEGLVLPAQITHNVFIIIPEKTQKHFCVSLWEVTRNLAQFLPQLQFDVDNIMKLRIDLVLLLILNGNDYLPKLRGSAGFHKLLHTYLRLLKQYLGPATAQNASNKRDGASGIGTPVNHGRLPFFFLDGKKSGAKGVNITELNTQFALDFFSELALVEPNKLLNSDRLLSNSLSVTPLSNLHRLLDGCWLPNPAKFEVIPGVTEGHETVRLTLGDPNLTTPIFVNGKNKETNLLSSNSHVNSSSCFIFEVDHREHTNLKSAKHRLSAIAIEELLGSTRSDIDDDEIFDQNDEDWEADMDEAAISMGQRTGLLQTEYSGLQRVPGYHWEVRRPAQADVKQYVAGLLWNVQTYKDGVCADYAYNYGRRLAPTSFELRQYLQNCIENNMTLALDRILPENHTPPLNAGLSCLAALPIVAKHLVPEPYRVLTHDNAVEDIYGKCMDATTNVFDIDKFRELCSDELQKIVHKIPVNEITTNLNFHFKSPRSDGRGIRTSSRHWTVLFWSDAHSGLGLKPPDPFSDRSSRLKHCSQIRASLIKATVEPKWKISTPLSRKRSRRVGLPREINPFSGQSLLDVPYKRPFCSNNNKPLEPSKAAISSVHYNLNLKADSRDQHLILQTKQNIQNQTSSAIVNMLVDSGFFASDADWSYLSSTQEATEIIVLSLEMGSPPKNFSWKSKRKYDIKRQLIKHHLASKVLTDIFGQEWTNLRIEQMREMKDIVVSVKSND